MASNIQKVAPEKAIRAPQSTYPSTSEARFERCSFGPSLSGLGSGIPIPQRLAFNDLILLDADPKLTHLRADLDQKFTQVAQTPCCF